MTPLMSVKLLLGGSDFGLGFGASRRPRKSCVCKARVTDMLTHQDIKLGIVPTYRRNVTGLQGPHSPNLRARLAENLHLRGDKGSFHTIKPLGP